MDSKNIRRQVQISNLLIFLTALTLTRASIHSNLLFISSPLSDTQLPLTSGPVEVVDFSTTVRRSSTYMSIPVIRDRLKGALFGMFVGDAVAMPVHWMYNLRELKKDYGTIREYVAPREKLVNSILSLSNTGGAGRGSSEGDIIGSVINHGKKKYWVKGGDYHYHVTLQSGENTLEAQLTRVLMKDIVDHQAYSPSTFLDSYVQFMTTPGSHNDTYASSCHRIFFANMVDGKPLEQCAGNDNHNVDAIDALTLATPLIVLLQAQARTCLPAVSEKVFSVVQTTRRTTSVQRYADAYTALLTKVIQGNDLHASIEEAGRELYGDSYSVKAQVAEQSGRQGDPMVACYIESSFPAMLFYAYKYGGSVEAGVLGSANGGGENVARGSLIGALLGAAYGYEQGFPAWAKTGLHAGDQITLEIDTFLDFAVESEEEL
jgi:ADP-ribosyl-[dinitrogen reductase] hydrolase